MSANKQTQRMAAFFAWPGETDDRRQSAALSIVAPMFNEEGGAARLVHEIAIALEGVEHEIIIVDDCSIDGTRAVLRQAQAQYPQLRLLVHEKNAGQSRALRTGILAARGHVIAMLDGDGQNDPADIPALFQALKVAPASVAMASGERVKRQDSAAKKFGSRFANGVRKRLLNDGAADTGCGLKVFYREAFLRLPFFDHMHRYLPALMRREGFEVVFLPVNHRARVHGRSKYTNFGRLAVAFRDLLGVIWLRARARSPQSVVEEGDSALQPSEVCDKVNGDR